MNNSKDFYPDSSFGNSYNEYIKRKFNKYVKADNNGNNVEPNVEETELSDENKADLDDIKSLLNQLLENQESILKKLDYLRDSKTDSKSSFIDRIFKG